ncbi:PucR family transcriptional regulator [Arthrobacter sp. CDRTa11]|uniref:PucR family transcriptional regulator n=1 Tax=Arthrobacter sp. CDRTa11 TaxID=2651199 RepID=UPI0022659415|nr:PucR family transcriptional regulator [Arthrobacter sp. CDRTa11]UZX02881.1 PucR family transcriptional regulator [Arthrobacter sp. CDRTa11]
MPPSLNVLLRSRALKLRLVVPELGSPRLEVPISWVHSSDLEDPTPFLDRGQLLLTDGTQFAVGPPAVTTTPGTTGHQSPEVQNRRGYEEYVRRLVDHGIAGLGFATQVIHGTLPPGLEEACRNHGLPLLEVPDRTPFIAIIRMVADYLAREEHARAEWSLQAQRAISRAALRPDGLTSILGELERQLHSWVALYDAAGNYVRMPRNRPVPSDIAGEVTQRVRSALDLGTRSASHLEIEGQSVTLQTLGRKGSLRGALVLGAIEPLDPARADIVNSVIGLASLALEQARTLDTARRHLRAGVFEQLLAGSTDVATRTAGQVWGQLPRDPLLVTASRQESPAPNLLEALELLADDYRGAVFYALRGELLVILAGQAHQGRVLELLERHGAVAGVSSETVMNALPDAFEEATRAAGRAQELRRAVVNFSELSEGGMLGLLREEEAGPVARGLLQPLLAHDAAEHTQLLETVREWLTNDCVWDKSARRLGVHRHTLRNRIDAAGRILGLNLDGMRDRLELFAAMQFLENDAGRR